MCGIIVRGRTPPVRPLPPRKIKKFRFDVKASSIFKLARAQSISLDSEDSKLVLEEEIKKASQFFHSAAIYETFQEAPPQWISESFKPSPVAWSGLAVTIGQDLENEMASAISSGDDHRAQVLSLIQESAVQEAAQFVWRLVSEEAKSEGLSLSDRLGVLQVENKTEIISRLNSERIGVELDSSGELKPRASCINIVVWMGKGQSRR